MGHLANAFVISTRNLDRYGSGEKYRQGGSLQPLYFPIYASYFARLYIQYGAIPTAIFLHVSSSHGFPDGMPVALFVPFLFLGAYKVGGLLFKDFYIVAIIEDFSHLGYMWISDASDIFVHTVPTLGASDPVSCRCNSSSSKFESRTMRCRTSTQYGRRTFPPTAFPYSIFPNLA
ncbi:uncharacterized protein LY89DRAFT_412122 [Mollisia scopiformis]|uniref:Uncharacterized protein n=1 Tax=Mollisia scopiformis TaxID=149040 RepID=A0A132B2C9_MOLSC|nr:uncharacterized protein LY89DRAFT_412122 [Mollisia scopiformis]KUJ06403.1 hypothetical protein LY89DRAFT_412122 [Mollisia scopiformis]